MSLELQFLRLQRKFFVYHSLDTDYCSTVITFRENKKSLFPSYGGRNPVLYYVFLLCESPLLFTPNVSFLTSLAPNVWGFFLHKRKQVSRTQAGCPTVYLDLNLPGDEDSSHRLRQSHKTAPTPTSDDSHKPSSSPILLAKQLQVDGSNDLLLRFDQLATVAHGTQGKHAC